MGAARTDGAGRTSAKPPDDQFIEEQLQQQINQALAKGGWYAALFGWIAGAGLLGALIATGSSFYLSPLVFSVVAGSLAFSIRILAARGRLHGWVAYAVMLAFVSLPTGFFASGYLHGSGTATFLTGPISYLYAFLIVIAGFLFNPRLAIVASLVAATEYMVMYALGRGHFAALQTPHDMLHIDLSSPIVWFNKGLILIGVGFATAGIAVIARRLLLQTLREARLFGQYVSPEIREKIVAGAEGERVRAVILFSDLRGFSSYSEGRDPEEVVSQLNEYFDRMVGCIRGEGGVVDKFIGDAIMAVFTGATGASDPASAAVGAARQMRRELRLLNERWRERGVEPFDNGIGIHIGDVVQGPIGSVDRKEWTVIGDAVNTAARLESLTRQHDRSIIITDSLHASLEPDTRASFTPLGTTTVKGKHEPLTIYGGD